MLLKNKLITVVTPMFNEEENVVNCYKQVKDIFSKIAYDYEHIFIDNASVDSSVIKIKNIIKKDKNIKLIVNQKNYGHVKSPFYGILQGSGSATILLHCDLQEPVSLFPKFIKKWEDGSQIILAQKKHSSDGIFVSFLKKIFYYVISKISNDGLIKNVTGAGLYDKFVIDVLKTVKDPYPYLRGLISELGFTISTEVYNQRPRQKGLSNNNIVILYDSAMNAMVNHSTFVVRIILIIGVILGLFSILISFFMLFAKLSNWNAFPVGYAPFFISISFLIGIILISIGLVGEYIISIHRRLKQLPLVIEKERVNI